MLMEAPQFTYGPSLRNNIMSTCDNHHSDTVSDTERNVRARIDCGYELIPYDHGTHIPDCLDVVTVEDMMEDECNTDTSIMHLQLIRIVSGSNSGQTNTSSFQSYLRKNKK